MEHRFNDVQRDWQNLVAILSEHDSFVFSTHIEPDADGIGSQLGLARYLKDIGKTVYILNPSSLRANLEFLIDADEVQVYNSAEHASIINESDVFIAFDIGHYSRLSSLCPDLESSDIIKVSIDHHPGDKSQFNYRYDYSAASSTGILIFDLIKALDNDALSRSQIALPLYTAIMSDTGNFRFNNTDPETFYAAARLVAAGVRPHDVYIRIYEDLNTPGRLVVLEYLLKTMQYDCDGRLAWSLIDFEEIRTLGVLPDDMHSLSDFIRSIRGVEIGVAFTKIAGQPTDVSFRSKGHIPINGVARHFGGGGHAFAAGCRIDSDLSAAANAVVDQCRVAINIWDANV